MARTRNIKPGFFLNDDLADLDPLARLLFVGLWTIADCDGQLEDRPRRIKNQLLPYDECDVNGLLQILADSPGEFIQRYEIEGTRYIAIPGFLSHQKPHPAEKSFNLPRPPVGWAPQNDQPPPAPPPEPCGNSPGVLALSKGENTKTRKKSGKTGKKPGATTPYPLSLIPSTSNPSTSNPSTFNPSTSNPSTAAQFVASRRHAAPATDLGRELVAVWNALDGVIRNLGKDLNGKRLRMLRTRLKDTAWWERAIEATTRMPFPWLVPGGWRPNLEWFLKPGNVEDILEGKYAEKFSTTLAEKPKPLDPQDILKGGKT